MFSDEAVRAIVREGDFRAPEAEAHLAATIIHRRDKVLARYFGSLNPLAGFRVTGTAPGFTNRGEDARLARVEGYEYQWFSLDNGTGRIQPLGPAERATDRSIPLPAERPEYLMVRIRTRAPAADAWRKRVDVYLRTQGEPKVVGVERES
jgi:hypothetical protein